MARHKLLIRQLNRCGLSESDFPIKLEQWQNFLSHVNQTYEEVDQDRYILERSQDISSKEMTQLLDSLQEAQKIARMGNWSYNIKMRFFTWSLEMYTLYDRDPVKGPLTYEEYLSYIHPDERSLLQKIFEKAIEVNEENEINEIEYRIVIEGKIRWMHAKIMVHKDKETQEIENLTGTVLDITDQVKAKNKISEVNEQLLIASRRAGMAEVASSVVHNIGNVLNSLNVSSSILMEIVTKTKFSNLNKISKLIKTHQDKLGEFIENDQKGKLIPEYIEKISLYWEEEQKIFVKCLQEMNEHIQHIKDIINRQQSLSGSLGIVRPVELDRVLDDAILIVFPDIGKNEVTIFRNFCEHEKILIDKISLLQILVNLIKNAKESLKISTTEQKLLSIKSIMNKPNMISIIIEDNGSGIAPENLTKIFSYGFTTKENGSGIGLHTSALFARNLSGSLEAFSDGINKGACFILKIPYKVSNAL